MLLKKFTEAMLNNSKIPIEINIKKYLGDLYVVLFVLLLGAIFGIVCAFMGASVAERPVLFAALPVLIGLGLTFYINPKMLVAVIILLRAAADPIFENARFGNLTGLGGMVNLAIIAIALTLVLKDPKRLPRQVWWAWLPFLCLQFIGLLHAPDAYPEARQLLAQVSTFAMFVAAFYLVDDLPSMERALRLILGSSVPVMIISIVYILNGNSYSSLNGAETVSERYAGPFPHPNILAFYTNLIIALNLYLIKRGGNYLMSWKVLWSILYTMILLVVLYSTKTRSAWIAAAVLFGIYGVLFERRYLLYLCLIPAVAMLIPEFRDRIFDLTQGNVAIQYARLNSFAWRQLAWQDGLQWMEPIRYFFGYGNGGFFFYYPMFNSMGGKVNFGAHNVLVQLFFDVGVFGVVAYLWLFIACFRMLRSNFRDNYMLKIFSTALLFGYFIISLSDNMLGYLTYNWYFWFFIGAACALISRLPGQIITGISANGIGNPLRYKPS